ncbi:MAG TPA: hypothetical protein VK776_15705 [Bryobacteraceae bacterium]|jgi:hypothetical protein|nr:hypothetical protein [Bryobacteraceae bacterium]
MTIQSNITIIKNLNRALIAGLMVAVFVFGAAPVFAHGGFDHVMGTVVQVSNNVLTVKTAKGNVDVKLDDKTELTKNDQKAQLTDLTPGARVVVDIPEGSKDKLAHSVKIGTASKAAAH